MVDFVDNKKAIKKNPLDKAIMVAYTFIEGEVVMNNSRSR